MDSELQGAVTSTFQKRHVYPATRRPKASTSLYLTLLHR
jgi:hypothetical protein